MRGNLLRELGRLSRRAAYGSQETLAAFIALAGDIAGYFKENWACDERPDRSMLAHKAYASQRPLGWTAFALLDLGGPVIVYPRPRRRAGRL